MEENYQKTIEAQIALAPVELQSFLKEGRWLSVAKEISQKNRLSAEQGYALENEVLFVLISMEFKGDIETNIKRELGIPDILAHDIAEEIKERVFKEVEDFLPTEIESEENIPKTLVRPAGNLIEDAAGNADNVSPPLETAPPAPEPSPIPAPQQPPQAPQPSPLPPVNLPTQETSLEKKITSQMGDGAGELEQEMNKNSADSDNTVMEKKYSGQDPYREPIA
jgi:hypothetical protein